MLNKILQSFQSYNKTNFIAGGLRQSRILASAENTLVKSPKFQAPRKLDFRDMCIMTSDQASTPHCAGYSTAGMIEVRNWRTKHYPEQVDGDAIYREAKKIDGDNNDGTSLDSAGQAAINLGLVSGKLQFVNSDFDSIKYCIHTNLAFVAGFNITDEWNYTDKKTGQILDLGDKAVILGGHAILVCGYDEFGVYIQNSWGSSWGIYGFALIPWSKVSKQFMYGMVII